MKLSRRLLFSLVPLLAAAALAEGGVRLAGLPAPDVSQRFEHNEVFWLTDPNLEDEPFPHRETGTTFRVSTDAQGLRAPLHRLTAPADTWRIMFLGCSTTFGWGVEDGETYPSLVEAALARRGYDQVEILNGGQPGYTSFQGEWFYREVGRHYSPDVVVFGYVVQDARRAAWSDHSQALLQQDARFLKRQLLYRSQAYLALKTAIHARQMSGKEREEGGEQGVYRVSRERYVANIRSFHEITRRDGARLALFGFPLEREGYTREHRRLLRLAAEELSLPHLDSQAEMESLARSRTLYFPQDRGHANADGHEVIADRIVSFLMESDLLPPPSLQTSTR